MPLGCECDYDGDYDWYYWAPDDYQHLATTKRKRCSSCKELIDIGAVCTEFTRSREVRTEIERRIYGEGDPQAIWLASYWLCEECSDLYFSLSELEFCVSPTDNMRGLVREYAEIWQHKPTIRG